LAGSSDRAGTPLDSRTSFPFAGISAGVGFFDSLLRIIAHPPMPAMTTANATPTAIPTSAPVDRRSEPPGACVEPTVGSVEEIMDDVPAEENVELCNDVENAVELEPEAVAGIIPSVIPQFDKLEIVLIDAANCEATDGAIVAIVLIGVP